MSAIPPSPADDRTQPPWDKEPGIASAYLARLGKGALAPDPAQAEAIRRLDALAAELATSPSKKSALGWLFSRRETRVAPKGLYIWGAVGRGKTMLMDLFFAGAPVKAKRRAHFLEFMADVHERIRRARAELAAGDGRDPIGLVARDLVAEFRLICFDEFAVTDIADAMILGRLFTRLFEAGVVMVATSNVDPAKLYPDGLNRQLFLPFIALLQERCDVLNLQSATDYRMEKLAGSPVYFAPLGLDADRAIDRLWSELTAGHPVHPVTLEVKSRQLVVPQASHDIARFSFEDLCARPLGALDYQLLATHFDTLVIERVPVLPFERRDEAKRFIMLIDTLYDNGVKVILSAAADPLALYTGDHGSEMFEWPRCASRLHEMRSGEYRARIRRAAPPIGVIAG